MVRAGQLNNEATCLKRVNISEQVGERATLANKHEKSYNVYFASLILLSGMTTNTSSVGDHACPSRFIRNNICICVNNIRADIHRKHY
jgi:hypothetical protein